MFEYIKKKTLSQQINIFFIYCKQIDNSTKNSARVSLSRKKRFLLYVTTFKRI